MQGDYIWGIAGARLAKYRRVVSIQYRTTDLGTESGTLQCMAMYWQRLMQCWLGLALVADDASAETHDPRAPKPVLPSGFPVPSMSHMVNDMTVVNNRFTTNVNGYALPDVVVQRMLPKPHAVLERIVSTCYAYEVRGTRTDHRVVSAMRAQARAPAYKRPPMCESPMHVPQHVTTRSPHTKSSDRGT